MCTIGIEPLRGIIEASGEDEMEEDASELERERGLGGLQTEVRVGCPPGTDGSLAWP